MPTPLSLPPPMPPGFRGDPAPASRDGVRWLGFERLCNVRDLGGYRGADGRRVRWGAVYRADALGRAADHPHDRARLAALGLRTVVDLRTEAELAGHTPAFTPGPEDAWEWWHHPVQAATWDQRGQLPAGDEYDDVVAFLVERYLDLLDEGAGAIGSTVALASEGECLPLVFHCAVGKDRTGVVAAVLLGLLGVPDAVISHDYGLSRTAMDELATRLARWSPDAHAQLMAHPAAYRAAPPAVVRRVLGAVRERHGSLERWADDALCLDAAAVGRLRDTLLEG